MELSKNTVKQNALARLKAQQAKLQARIQLLEARHKTSERKNDTRRKILIGSYYLDQAKEQGNLDEIRARKNIRMDYYSHHSVVNMTLKKLKQSYHHISDR